MDKASEKERVFKRYKNRKIYDTSTGVYVNLSQIVDLVRAGKRFVVKDHVTGKDLTGYVLATALMHVEMEATVPERRETLYRLLAESQPMPRHPPSLASPQAI